MRSAFLLFLSIGRHFPTKGIFISMLEKESGNDIYSVLKFVLFSSKRQIMVSVGKIFVKMVNLFPTKKKKWHLLEKCNTKIVR